MTKTIYARNDGTEENDSMQMVTNRSVTMGFHLNFSVTSTKTNRNHMQCTLLMNFVQLRVPISMHSM